MLTNLQNGLLATPLIGGGVRVIGARKGATNLFVDGQNGSDANNGQSPDEAVKTIDHAIDLSSAWGVIYVFPKNYSGTDPGYYSEQLIIPIAKQGLAIIGAGNNPSNPFGVQVKGSAAGAILTVRAPFCSVENICFNRGSATTGAIVFEDDGGTASLNLGNNVSGCHFRNMNDGTTGNGSVAAGVIYAGGVQGSIVNNYFYNCRGGIIVKSATSVVQAVEIVGNRFLGDVASIDTDIYVAAFCSKVLIGGNYFEHETPAYSGGLTAYIYWLSGATDTGGIVDNYFASADVVIAATGTDHIYVADGTLISWAGNYDQEGLIAGSTS
jgi:hypothetical protein